MRHWATGRCVCLDTHRCPCAIGPCVYWHKGPALALPADHADIVFTERKLMLGTCPMCEHTLLYPPHTHPLSLSPTTSPALSLSHRHHTSPSQRPRMTSTITPKMTSNMAPKVAPKVPEKKEPKFLQAVKICKNLALNEYVCDLENFTDFYSLKKFGFW